MDLLTKEQRQRALEAMKEYLSAPKNPDGKTPFERQTWRDHERTRLITQDLQPLLESFLRGDMPLEEFKSSIDGINKRHEHWGFKGIKGQMFFNMLVNVATNSKECDEELKSALALPNNEDVARNRIRAFADYVRRIGEKHVNNGGTHYQKPKVGSVPFFLSYFWQIQNHRAWPVYYTNSVNTMSDLNLWEEGEDISENYIEYKKMHEVLSNLFTQASGKTFDLYGVEHVFWFKGGNPFGENKPLKQSPPSPSYGDSKVTKVVSEISTSSGKLPDSYVPPVVSILPQMALHSPELVNAAKASGTSLDRAFEKSINACLTILGYETALLGQGQGRVPDGRAVDSDNRYAILWDAKVRSEGYRMGSDDRAIREYVLTQSRDLKRTHSIRNIYYAIISSSFSDDFDDAIRMLKMETDINEVCLIEASALVAIVEGPFVYPVPAS
ncbi:MAG: hypothetical protein HS116_17220 [Planctomycetes bacterium]|nr:hypothetical protein [Planctomycetota bacterium]